MEETIQKFLHLTMSDGCIVLSYSQFHEPPHIWSKSERTAISKAGVYWIVSQRAYNQLFSEAEHIRDTRGNSFVQICKAFARYRPISKS